MSLINYSFEGFEEGTHSKWDFNEIKSWCREKVDLELKDLNSPQHILIKPIPLVLRYENKTYFVIQPELNLWDEDKTYEGVLKTIARQILVLFDRLSILSTQDKLGPYPKELLILLKKYVKPA